MWLDFGGFVAIVNLWSLLRSVSWWAIGGSLGFPWCRCGGLSIRKASRLTVWLAVRWDGRLSVGTCGLAICWKLAVSWDGRIAVSGELGQLGLQAVIQTGRLTVRQACWLTVR